MAVIIYHCHSISRIKNFSYVKIMGTIVNQIRSGPPIRSRLQSLMNRLWKVDDYAKFRLTMDLYHGIHASIIWTHEGRDVCEEGYGESIDQAIESVIEKVENYLNY